MKLIIDTESRTLTREDGDERRVLDLYSTEAFEILSLHWVRVGWNQKSQYTFTWMGRPIIQLPEDMVRAQEVIYRVKPDVIIETGIAHGGTLIFYASLCKAMNKGRVIGIDIEIRPHNRKAIKAHELFPYITMIEGNSIDDAVAKNVKSLIREGEKVMVILDSCHTKDHVSRELELYHDVVTKDSYIVATDGIMRDLYDVPRGKRQWLNDNPIAAATEFASTHLEFILEKPAWPFNESDLTENITHWTDAWLRRV
ncbi:MAG: cephalosporin hydroxylase family protein [Gammaproteobacteria bacterium]|jgi:cephalosporin hydroxylase|nr:cephalosporin hydroxylase family protein [Gammaproteobacteria bacterium]